MKFQLQELFKIHGTPTLKSLAVTLSISAPRLYKIAKTSAEDIPLERNEYNWAAIERFLFRRLDPDAGLGTMEDVLISALKNDEKARMNDRRRTGMGYYSNHEIFECDGKEHPMRRHPSFEMPKTLINAKDIYPNIHPSPNAFPVVLLRTDTYIYMFIYQTKTHTALRSIGPAGGFNQEKIRVISNRYFNMHGLTPNQATKEEVTARYIKQGYDMSNK